MPCVCFRVPLPWKRPFWKVPVQEQSSEERSPSSLSPWRQVPWKVTPLLHSLPSPWMTPCQKLPTKHWWSVMMAPWPWGRSWRQKPKQLKQPAQFSPQPSRRVAVSLPLQKDLSDMGVKWQLARVSRLSALSLAMSIAMGVFSNWCMRSSLSMALYSASLEQVSQAPIKILTRTVPTLFDYTI